MNVIKTEISNCHDCTHCHHNGLLQAHPKYVCHHPDLSSTTVDAKYWYKFPILGAVNKKNGNQIDIPNWCPILEKQVGLGN